MKLRIAKIKSVGRYLSKNKYWLTITVFVLSIMFFHPYNVLKLIKNKNTLTTLETQENYLSVKIIEDSTKLSEIKKNNLTLEKYAREQYFFHKPNEDVFVIERNTD